MNEKDAQTKQRRIDEIQDARDHASSSISTQTRSMALGILAICWLLLGGTQQSLTIKFQCYTDQLLAIAAACVVAIALDLAQYVFQFFDHEEALEDSRAAENLEGVGFNATGAKKFLGTLCFWGKLLVSAVAGVWLISVMIGALVR